MRKHKWLDEEKYLVLCKYCDQILKERQVSLIRTSIPFLHIIREHPIFLKKYSLLLNNGFFERLKLFTRTIIGLLRIFRSSFFNGKRMWYGSDREIKSLDFLFVSHLVNEKYSNGETDFYFGTLPYSLNDEGYHSAIALINHTKQEKPLFFSKTNKKNATLFLLSKHLSLRREFSFFTKIFTEAFELIKLKRKVTDPLFKKVITSSIYDGFSKNTFNSLRVYKQIYQLVKTCKPKIIITTYEGHSWERIAFAAARSANTEIKCIAYQHSTIFRLQHAIRRSLDPQFNPDVILCSGMVGMKQLEKSRGLNGIPLFVLGSNRTIDISSVKSKEEFIDINSNPSKCCLVIPEGDIIECNILFEFSINCAKEFPTVKFIWRLHPLVTFERLVELNYKLRDLPGNISLSSGSLLTDIAKCNLALYRGSTAIIQAANMGLTPIYLALHEEMSIDPLYEIMEASDYVYTVIDFKKIIDRDMPWNQYLIIKEYCSQIFQPLNDIILKQQLPFFTS